MKSSLSFHRPISTLTPAGGPGAWCCGSPAATTPARCCSTSQPTSVTSTWQVFLNGAAVVSHAGGHLPFEAEITAKLDFSLPNLLTVAVNNTLTRHTVPQVRRNREATKLCWPPDSVGEFPLARGVSQVPGRLRHAGLQLRLLQLCRAAPPRHALLHPCPPLAAGYHGASEE